MIERKLTKAEEQVMQYVWDLDRAFLKDIVEKFPEPRPAYTTVSTVVRVLVRKGFIGFRTFGKINEYYASISRGEYFHRQVKPMLTRYFRGSPSSVVSYFANSKLELTELEEIKKLIDDRIKKIKAKKNK